MMGCFVGSGVALWRRWSPPLYASLLFGLVLRMAIVLLAQRYTPHDVSDSFWSAGHAVLHGRDPLSILPRYQWNFLPFSAYLFAAEIKTGLTWRFASKLLPVTCDLVTIVLVGELRRGHGRGNAELLYALSPLAILISAWHGQLEPIAITLGLGGLLLSRRQNPTGAGLLAGLAVAAKSWPGLFLPGVLLYLPLRRWWQSLLAGLAVIVGWLLVIPLALHDGFVKAIRIMLSYRSFSGTWGWSGLLRYAHLTSAGYAGPHIDTVQRAGTTVTIVAIVAVVAIFRRCSPEDITLAVILAFLAVTAGAGPQYLLWPAALLYAAQRRAGYMYLALATVWIGLFYLYAFPRGETRNTSMGLALEILSVVIVLSAVASMPWSRRSADRQSMFHPTRPLFVE